MNYTYILECEDHTYYTGWTNDLKKRFQAHLNGKGVSIQSHIDLCASHIMKCMRQRRERCEESGGSSK